MLAATNERRDCVFQALSLMYTGRSSIMIHQPLVLTRVHGRIQAGEQTCVMLMVFRISISIQSCTYKQTSKDSLLGRSLHRYTVSGNNTLVPVKYLFVFL